MKLSISTIALSLIVLFNTGCKKVYDYIDKNPTETCDACKIAQITTNFFGNTIVFNPTYDNKGNLVSLTTKPNPVLQNLYFRYDKFSRLTDWIVTYPDQTDVILWQHYSYLPGKIVDSSYLFQGSLNDPHPPYGQGMAAYTIYYLDKYGRIIKNSDGGTYNYDAQGNLIKPFTTYDNKINPLRISTMWQLLHRDYSANNPVNVPNTTLQNPEILSYNAYGLPTKYKRVDPNPGQNFIFAIPFDDSMEIKYDCDLSGIKY